MSDKLQRAAASVLRRGFRGHPMEWAVCPWGGGTTIAVETYNADDDARRAFLAEARAELEAARFACETIDDAAFLVVLVTRRLTIAEAVRAGLDAWTVAGSEAASLAADLATEPVPDGVDSARWRERCLVEALGEAMPDGFFADGDRWFRRSARELVDSGVTGLPTARLAVGLAADPRRTRHAENLACEFARLASAWDTQVATAPSRVVWLDDPVVNASLRGRDFPPYRPWLQATRRSCAWAERPRAILRWHGQVDAGGADPLMPMSLLNDDATLCEAWDRTRRLDPVQLPRDERAPGLDRVLEMPAMRGAWIDQLPDHLAVLAALWRLGVALWRVDGTGIWLAIP